MKCIVCVFYVAVTMDVFVVVLFVVFSCLGEGRGKLLVIVVLSWRGCLFVQMFSMKQWPQM